MRHRYFSESLRFLYGIRTKASLVQKPGAVKNRLEVSSTPELGSSQFRPSVGVSEYHQ